MADGPICGRYEKHKLRFSAVVGEDVTEETPLWWSGRNQVEVNKRAHVIKALLYAAQNFYAFMLM